MYFNPQVKEKRQDFFNFELLQNEFQNALKDSSTPLIAIYGLRRTGKTSLIRVVLNIQKRKYVWIDGRTISSEKDFYQKLMEAIQKKQRFRIQKISFKSFQLDLQLSKNGLEYMNKHQLILVIDEAQLLKRIRLDKVIAFIYDNFPQIKMILSGSEMGMLFTFLGKNSAKAPLYGRAVFELQTHRLDPETGYSFLRLGAKQASIPLSDIEIQEAIAQLDGIIGWLTKYGWYRRRFKHKEALQKTVGEGKLVAKEEFLKFSARSEKVYHSILQTMKGGARWEEIKQKVGISDKQLYSMLKRLLDGGFIEKSDRVYKIADPLLEAAV